MLATKPVILVSDINMCFLLLTLGLWKNKDSSTTEVHVENNVTTYRIVKSTEPLISCHGCFSCHSIRKQVFMKLSVRLRRGIKKLRTKMIDRSSSIFFWQLRPQTLWISWKLRPAGCLKNTDLKDKRILRLLQIASRCLVCCLSTQCPFYLSLSLSLQILFMT